MAVDRITQDMRSMARSYNAPRSVSLMQDKMHEVKHAVRSKVGDIKSARDAANANAKNVVAGAVKSMGKSVVQGATAAAKSIESGFEGLKQRNNARHRELVSSNRTQTNLLTGMNNTIGGIHIMMFKDRYGPKVEQYKRDSGGDVSALADQLGRQHRETMQELEKIRRAILMGGGGGLGSLFGGMRGGFGGGRRGPRGGGGGGGGRNNRGGGTRPGGSGPGGRGPRVGGGGWPTGNQSSPGQQTSARDAARTGRGANRSPSPTSTQASTTSSWGRSNGGSVGGATSQRSGAQGPRLRGRARLLEIGLTGAAAVGTGFGLFGGSDDNDRPVTNTPYRGLGSISASNESTRGVHEISSGRGDHGGVSYGTHQLASNNGSMQAFLRSPEGQPFASAFGRHRPGTEAFNNIYRDIAQTHEQAFSEAQSNYIKRTHYEPMVNNVRRGSGFDATGRGPAIQEMLYSTGVQYGTGTSVINKALRGRNPNSMTDEEIIRVVQNYKGETVGSYFRSSSANVQQSVRRRAYREMEQLLALNSQYENGELGEEWGDYGSQGENQVAAATSASTPADAPPLMGDGGTGTGVVTALGAAGAVAAVGGASVISSSPASATAPTPAAAPSTTPLETRNASVQSQTPARPTPPASRRAPAGPPRVNAAQAAVQAPPASIAAPTASVTGGASAPTPASPSATSRAISGARRVPILTPAIAAYDVATIVTDDEMTGSEKAGAVTDVAGGTVGGIAGAKAGAAAGGAAGLLAGPAAPVAVPVGAFIGGVVGGIGGYWAGSEATHSARNWIGSWWGDDEDEAEVEETETLPATGIPPEAVRFPDASNDPLMAAMVRQATGVQETAERASDSLEEAQAGLGVSLGAVQSATQIASTLASAESREGVDDSAVESAREAGAEADVPVVVNNFPVQGEQSDAQSTVEGATQVAQTPVQSSEDAENAALLDGMSQAMLGAAIPGLAASGSNPAQNLQSAGQPSRSGVGTGAAVAGATAVAAGTAGMASSAFDDDSDGNSFLLNQMSQMIFGTSLPSLEMTRPDAPEHMRQNLHGYNAQTEPVRPPTTVREGNTVTHDFTNRPPPPRAETGQEITATDLATRPVGQGSRAVDSALANIDSARREVAGQANMVINDLHTHMSVRPVNARSALNATGNRASGQATPMSGTAPTFMGDVVTSSPVSVGATRSTSSGSPTTSSASDFSSQAVSDVPSHRQQHDSVQKVMMMEPAGQTHERKDLTQDPRMASTSATFEGRHHQPSIDDTPALVSDFGLTLLNTGFI